MNEEQLQEFKALHGLDKNAPGAASDAFDGVSVRTPNLDKYDDISMVNADGTIKQIAKAGIRDRSEERQLASEKK